MTTNYEGPMACIACIYMEDGVCTASHCPARTHGRTAKITRQAHAMRQTC